MPTGPPQPNAGPGDWKDHLVSSSQKIAYHGDLYGTRGHYENGILYLSRMSKPNKDDDIAVAVYDSLKPLLTESQGGEGEKGVDGLGSTKAKKRCAQSLSKMSWNIDLAPKLIKSGVLRAVMLLLSIESSETQEHGAITLCNVAHSPLVAKIMIDERITPTILLLSSEDNSAMKYNCALILCFLSALPTAEYTIVADGAIQCLGRLRNNDKETELVCVTALYNLTCIDRSVSKNVDAELITALTQLAYSLAFNATDGLFSLGILEICMKAFLNISSRKHSRNQLLTDGIVPILISAITRDIGKSNHRLFLLYATILSNLSGKPISRPTILLPAIPVIIGLADIVNDETKSEIATVIGNVAACGPCQSYLINNGVIAALIKMVTSGNVETKKRAVLAFRNLLYYQEGQKRMIAEGIIPMLVELCVNDEPSIQEAGLESACLLLCDSDCVDNYLDCSGLSRLVEATTALIEKKLPDLITYCAHSCYNLTCFSQARVQMISGEKCIPTLLSLAAYIMDNLPAIGIEAIRYISSSILNLASLTGSDGLTALGTQWPVGTSCIALLQVDDFPVRFNALSALYHLSANCDAATSLIDNNVLPALCAVIKADEERKETKEINFCVCTAICNLTIHDNTRAVLVNQGIVKALTQLAKNCIDVTSASRISIALCNLSESTAEAREKMLNDGAIQTIVALSSNYNNRIQQDSARAICNLSYLPATETTEQQSSVKTLMVIGLVWTDDTETKILCAKALLNLLSVEASRASLIEDGVLSAFVSFAETEDPRLLQLCSKAFRNLSYCKEGRARLTKDRNLGTLRVLAADNDDSETKRNAVEALTNLFYHYGAKFGTVAEKHNIVSAFNSLSMYKNSEIHSLVSICIAVMSTNEGTAVGMVRDNVMKALTSLVKEASSYLLVAFTFAALSLVPENRVLIGAKGGVTMVVQMLQHTMSSAPESHDTIRYATIALLNLSTVKDNVNAIVQADGVPTLIELLGHPSSETRYCAIHTLCLITYVDKSLIKFVSQGGLHAVLTCIKSPDNSVRIACVAAVSYLTCNATAQYNLVEEKTVTILVDILTSSGSDEAVNSRCLYSLRNMSAYARTRPHILSSDFLQFGIPYLERVSRMGSGEEVVSEAMKVNATNIMVILANSSYQPDAPSVYKDEVINCIIKITKMRKEVLDLKDLGAVTLSNLHPDGEMNIVPTLLQLSGISLGATTDEMKRSRDMRSDALLPLLPLPHPDVKLTGYAKSLVSNSPPLTLPSNLAPDWEKSEGGHTTSKLPLVVPTIPLPQQVLRTESEEEEDNGALGSDGSKSNLVKMNIVEVMTEHAGTRSAFPVNETVSASGGSTKSLARPFGFSNNGSVRLLDQSNRDEVGLDSPSKGLVEETSHFMKTNAGGMAANKMRRKSVSNSASTEGGPDSLFRGKSGSRPSIVPQSTSSPLIPPEDKLASEESKLSGNAEETYDVDGNGDDYSVLESEDGNSVEEEVVGVLPETAKSPEKKTKFPPLSLNLNPPKRWMKDGVTRSCAAAGCGKTTSTKFLYCSIDCENKRVRRLVEKGTKGLRAPASTAGGAGSSTDPALSPPNSLDDGGSTAVNFPIVASTGLNGTRAAEGGFSEDPDVVAILYEAMFSGSDEAVSNMLEDKFLNKASSSPVHKGRGSPTKSRSHPTLPGFANIYGVNKSRK